MLAGVSSFFRTKEGETTDWEALIGGSWLNVIGIIVFVVGMALLAQHSLSQFGPIGKISTGVVTSIALLLSGIWLEKAERYRLLAWTLIGGGWALLYFTAYAAYNIEASKIITDGLVAYGWNRGCIILHSLRYRSQLLTGLAYGLGFFAVTIMPLNAYTLLSAAVLAISQIAVLRFLPWHYLALIAVAGTYLNHARWVGETTWPHQDFWLINTVGMLGLSAWQIWVLHGENLYYLTASATLAYAGAATVSRLNSRVDLFRFNASTAVVLFAITLPLAVRPLDISRDWLAVYWALGGLLVVACGYILRELPIPIQIRYSCVKIPCSFEKFPCSVA